MSERLQNAVIVCAMAWSLLLLQILSAALLVWVDSASGIPPIVSELLPFSFVISFVSVLYYTLVLAVVWTADKESHHENWHPVSRTPAR